MKNHPFAATVVWPIGSRTCTVTVPRPGPGEVPEAVVEWSPDCPAEMSPQELREYRKVRTQALAAASKLLGIGFVVLDFDRPPEPVRTSARQAAGPAGSQAKSSRQASPAFSARTRARPANP